jgi:3-hydroxyisobutyrate dehydrogenase
MSESLSSISPGETRIGWIGTGVMGASMARHLAEAGFELDIYTRTKSKAQDLLDRGAHWHDSVASLAESADVIFTIVGFPHDVRSIYLDANGLIASGKPGQILVDMTTSQPSLAVEIAETALSSEKYALDAPVSGGDVGAKNGTLSIMIGGNRGIFDSLMPCWNAMGKTVVYQGESGSGQHTKMVNQTLIATGMIGVCEALLYAFRAGLNIETVLQSVSSGAAGSWSLSNLAPRILESDFEPGFFVDHFVKDMGIVLAEARAMQLSLPGLALAHQFYVALQSANQGNRGTQALMLALARLNAIDWENR